MNVAGFKIQTIVTYDHETHFDVNKKKRSGENQVLKLIPSKCKIGNRILWISRSGFFMAVKKSYF